MSKVEGSRITLDVSALSSEKRIELLDAVQQAVNEARVTWLAGSKVPVALTEVPVALTEVPRVVVNLHRGLLENVRSSTDWLDVLVLDDDLDGVDQERIVKVEGRDTTAEFYCFEIVDYLGQLFGTVEGLMPADE